MNNMSYYITIGRSASWDNNLLAYLPITYKVNHPNIIYRNLGMKGADVSYGSIMGNLFRYTYLRFLREAPDDTYRFCLKEKSGTSIRRMDELSYYIRKKDNQYDLIDAFSKRVLCSYKVKEEINYELIEIKEAEEEK